MATLAVTAASVAGIDIAAVDIAAAGGGDSFVNDGKTLFYVLNGGGSPITVTIAFQPATVAGGTVTDPTVSVAAGAHKVMGPFDPRYYNSASGMVDITYSAVTTVTVLPIRVAL